MEIWKQFKNTEYYISNLGEVKNSYGKLLKTFPAPNGYKRIKIIIEGKRKVFMVHRLVAETFIGDINNLVIDHIDRNKTNNNVTNLRIVTVKENNNNKRKVSLSNIIKIVELTYQGFSIDEIDKLINI